MSGYQEQLGTDTNELVHLMLSTVTELSQKVDREVIVYHSGFLQNQDDSFNVQIDDRDMSGFMNAVKNLRRNKGLDILLHTPGGNPIATESIVMYLKKIFGEDIRVIIPHLALSAGTLFSFASQEIIMGKHSFMGPVDPQFNGIPALSILEEFREAEKELTGSSNNMGVYNFWKIQLDKYPTCFRKVAQDAVDLTNELVVAWLTDSKLIVSNSKIKDVLSKFNDNSVSKNHARHFTIQECIDVGLKIKSLEEDQNLQDIVLKIHHINSILSSRGFVKIIANSSQRIYALTK